MLQSPGPSPWLQSLYQTKCPSVIWCPWQVWASDPNTLLLPQRLWPPAPNPFPQSLIPLPNHLLSLHAFSTAQANSPITAPTLLPCYCPPSLGLSFPNLLPLVFCVHGYSLTSMALSEQSLKELQTVRTAKPGLVISHPALDSHPSPPTGFSSAL